MKRKGFTLVELLIVVIILGLLITFAVPQYLNAVEKAKIGKAKTAMALLLQAETLYNAEKGVYCVPGTPSSNSIGTIANSACPAPAGGTLASYVTLPTVADTSWTYTVAGAAPVTITAARAAGSSYAGNIQVDTNGACTPTGSYLVAGNTPGC